MTRKYMINFLLTQINGESFTTQINASNRLNSLTDEELIIEFERVE